MGAPVSEPQAPRAPGSAGCDLQSGRPFAVPMHCPARAPQRREAVARWLIRATRGQPYGPAHSGSATPVVATQMSFAIRLGRPAMTWNRRMCAREMALDGYKAAAAPCTVISSFIGEGPPYLKETP